MLMTKDQLVQAIMGLNPTAAVDFLMRFDALDLGRYLEHLQLAMEPRGRDSVWVRHPDSPAIMRG